jgi:hypothetical protein
MIDVNVRNILVIGFISMLMILVSKVIVNKYRIFAPVQDTVNTI